MAIVVDFGFPKKPISRPTTSLPTCLVYIFSLLVIFFSFLWVPSSDVYCLPLLRLWQGGMQFLTQPVLFCLVNVVILIIWFSSGLDSKTVCDLKREGKLQALSGSTKPTSQNCSSNYIGSLTTEMYSPCSHKDHACYSKEFSRFEVFPASRNWVKLKTSPMKCFTSSYQTGGNRNSTAAASEIPSTNPKEQGASDIVNLYPTSKEDCSTENSSNKCQKAAQNDFRETKKGVANSGASAATRRPKLESRSASFPKVAPSREVVPRNTSMRKADKAEMSAQEIVMEKDELNERIEAFFARFREQLRRDSLSTRVL